MRPIQHLTDLFAELPGIGPRQARRIVQFLLRADKRFTQQLSEYIQTIHAHVRQCVRCFRYDEINSDSVCVLCADPNRQDSTLLVVEKDVDVEGIESAGSYTGHYFVLGALIPLSTNRKNKLAPRVSLLLERLAKSPAVNEVVLAFATTPEGDFTAQELKRTIKEKRPALTVSLLARGLSLGAEIEYADQETLRSALQGRS